jgi:cytochrome c oxidase subunit II
MSAVTTIVPGPVMRVLGTAMAAAPDGGTALHSALAPAGPQAARIAGLWWLFFWVSLIVFVLVVTFMLVAVVRARHRGPGLPRPLRDLAGRSRRLATVGVAVATALTVVVLIGLLAADVVTARAIAALRSPEPVTIELTGRQWWWEVRYWAPVPDRTMTTANEIHIPVGRPVLVKNRSGDVIHSLWVPNLHGKRDLIPGYQTTLTWQADRPGTYYGQCAEFCGYQHAHMRLAVIAEPPAEFEAWLERQRQAAPEPIDELSQRGRTVFLSRACVMCHTIRGTDAGGRVGPELTHLASRGAIAAGTLPNTTGHLAGWILDPQHVKPGALMPATSLAADELQALLAYLGTLK